MAEAGTGAEVEAGEGAEAEADGVVAGDEEPSMSSRRSSES